MGKTKSRRGPRQALSANYKPKLSRVGSPKSRHEEGPECKQSRWVPKSRPLRWALAPVPKALRDP